MAILNEPGGQESAHQPPLDIHVISSWRLEEFRPTKWDQQRFCIIRVPSWCCHYADLEVRAVVSDSGQRSAPSPPAAKRHARTTKRDRKLTPYASRFVIGRDSVAQVFKPVTDFPFVRWKELRGCVS
jgi:hypothetical protein